MTVSGGVGDSSLTPYLDGSVDPPGTAAEPTDASASGGVALPADRPTLGLGTRGDAVSALQRALNAWRATRRESPIGTDGSFGSGTQKAVQEFQRAHGLSADGSVGGKTWGALAAAVGGGSAPSIFDDDPRADDFPTTVGVRPGPVHGTILSAEAVARLDADDAAKAAKAAPAATGIWAGFDRFVDTLPATPKAFDGNKVQLLVDGPQAFPAMKSAVEGAKSSIEFETFDFFGRTATNMADLLICKAQQGVQVRAIIDEASMADPAGKAAIQRLQAFAKTSGMLQISVQPAKEIGGIFGTVAGGKGTAALHTHRKSLIVDGSTSFIGGMNFTDEESSGSWHDMHAQLTGPAVSQERYHFYNHWQELNPRAPRPDLTPPPAVTPSGDPGDNVRIIAHTPGQDENIRQMYVKAINTSQKSIRVEDPYFTDPPIMEALIAAAKRGVKVQCVWPAMNDSQIAMEAGRSWYPRLIAAGAEVYEYRDRMAHEKVATFDGKVATIGSSNLDRVSLSGMHEQNMIAIDRDRVPGFARTLDDQIQSDILHGSTRIGSIAKAVSRDETPGGIMSMPSGRIIALDRNGNVVPDSGIPLDGASIESADTGQTMGLEDLVEPTG